jgi:hypothetical protein
MIKNKITVDGVEYYREHPDLEKAKKVLENWDWMKCFVRNELELAQGLYDNMKDEGLSFGMIEAEGYLRCAKTMQHKIVEIDETR